MKILQINSGKHVNGAMVHTYLLAREMQEMDQQVWVVCHPERWLWDHCRAAGIPCLASSMRRRWSEIKRVREVIRQEGIDVIHTHMSRAHMFGLLLRWSTGVPCVATAHGCHFQPHWWWNDWVIANSEATRRYQIRINRVPAARIETIYCTSDLTRFSHVDRQQGQRLRNLWGLGPADVLLGIVGEVAPRKGHLVLLQALPALQRRFPNLKVWIVGRADRDSAYVRKLRRFLQRNRIWGCVRWLGKRENVPEYMAAMDLCLVPSLEEPLGLVAMEAQAVGTVVIASDAGGLPEIVQHRRNGWVVPKGDSLALGQAVEHLLEHPKLMKDLAEQGRQDCQRFSLTDMTAQVVKRLAQVVEHRRGSRK